MSFTVEGLIIKTIPYRESDHILTVFSKEQGLISLFCKKKNRPNVSFISPLVQAEFVLRQGKGELYLCEEISLIDSFLKIREKIESFEAAFQILRLILDSQFPHKSAPQLYELLIRYFQEIPLSAYPQTLSASFSAKVLRHEGLFGLNLVCATCQTPLETCCYAHQGESFCQIHEILPSIIMQKEELETLLFLAFCRNLNELSTQSISLSLYKKTLEFFYQSIRP